MSRLGHYARVYLAFVRTCVIREMSFRTHFFLVALSNTSWTVLSLAFAGFLFGNVRSVAGWDLDRMILLTGTFSLVLGLLDMLFQTNMARLSEQVNRGELDFVLVKPIDSQFYVSTRYINLNEVPAVIVAAATVIAGAARIGLEPTIWDVVTYITIVVCAVITFYGIWFLTVTFSLWTGRINNIAYLILPIADLGRLPTDVYRGGYRLLFTFVIPVALISTIPAQALLGMVDLPMVAFAILAAVVSATLSHWFWRYSLTRYASASS